MPRMPVHTVESAPQQSQPALKAVRDKLGTVLNIAGEMAHSPVVIGMYKAMNDAVAEHGTFDAPTREAIALAVGNQDGCGYCQSAHTLSAVQAGFNQDQTVAIRNARIDFDRKLDALLTLAREIAANVGEASEDSFEAAKQAGWTDEELTELFAHVAVNLFTNYFNHYAGTELDVPAAPALAS